MKLVSDGMAEPPINNNCRIMKFNILGGDREPRGNTEENKLHRK